MNNVRVCMCDCSNKSKSARAECRAKLAWALLRRSRFSRQSLKERTFEGVVFPFRQRKIRHKKKHPIAVQ